MLKELDELLWGPGTLILLLGTGIYLNIRTGFLPCKNLGYAIKSALGQDARRSGRSGVSPFSTATAFCKIIAPVSVPSSTK